MQRGRLDKSIVRYTEHISILWPDVLWKGTKKDVYIKQKTCHNLHADNCAVLNSNVFEISGSESERYLEILGKNGFYSVAGQQSAFKGNGK